LLSLYASPFKTSVRLRFFMTFLLDC
jgi:hypothetical protein